MCACPLYCRLPLIYCLWFDLRETLSTKNFLSYGQPGTVIMNGFSQHQNGVAQNGSLLCFSRRKQMQQHRSSAGVPGTFLHRGKGPFLGTGWTRTIAEQVKAAFYYAMVFNLDTFSD